MQPRLATLRAHLLTLLASVALSGLLVWQRAAPPATALRILPAPSPPPTRAAATATPPTWQVHVTGAVADPGLVHLAPGARVADAVAAAGGLSAAADDAAINLAASLADGLQIHVPAQGEPPPAAGAAAALGPATMGGPGTAFSFAAPSAIGGALSSGPGGPASAAPDSAPGSQIDLNSAGAAELESLPGVGPALAARILEHRQAKGPFRTVQDLLEVPGIGEKTLARFVERLVVR